MQARIHTRNNSRGGCIYVFCKLCILLAILGITRVVYYLRDKGLFARTQEVHRNLLPDISVFLKLLSSPHLPLLPSPWSNFLSRLSLGSLHSTGASSSWGGVPFSIKKLPPFAFSQTLSFSFFRPRGGASNSNMKFGTTQKCFQHKRRYVYVFKDQHKLKENGKLPLKHKLRKSISLLFFEILSFSTWLKGLFAPNLWNLTIFHLDVLDR